MSLCGHGHLFGRVFKIRKKVVHDFVELSTLKRDLIKWVTPLGVR